MITKDLAQARELLRTALVVRGFDAYQTSKYTIEGKDFTTKFCLSFMPGNRRTVISHAVEVFPEYRGAGIGTRNSELREEACMEAGITLMLATVKNSNAAEVRVMEKRGWKRLTNNLRTDCSLWGKQL